MFRGDGQFGGGPSPDEERQRVRDTVKGTLVSFVALCALIRLSKYGWEFCYAIIAISRLCLILCYRFSISTNNVFFLSSFRSPIRIEQIAEPVTM